MNILTNYDISGCIEKNSEIFNKFLKNSVKTKVGDENHTSIKIFYVDFFFLFQTEFSEQIVFNCLNFMNRTRSG